jgi:beta-alanine--pyruvate transaminase
MSAYFLEALFSLKDIGVVTDIRGHGMMGGLDVDADGAPGARGHALQKRLYDNGVHVKTTGDSAILAPAFVMTADQIDQAIGGLRKTLQSF